MYNAEKEKCIESCKIMAHTFLSGSSAEASSLSNILLNKIDE